MKTRLHWTLAVTVALAFAPSLARGQQKAPPPTDRPVSATERCQLEEMHRVTAPLTEQARATYPDAKRRFLAGELPRDRFFVTTRLHDPAGREEQIFVVVDSILDGRISGRIASPVRLIAGYRMNQPHAVDEAALIDWTVSRPDGTEEGNVVGKFFDTYKPKACPSKT
jgi:hypothetical protein